jgi:uncharacterized protein (TIGR02145 family)
MLTNGCKKKDETVAPEPTPISTTTPATMITGTMSDIDNNVYHTVTIGTQVWMSENLKVTKYRNGDPIPNVTDNTQWGIITTGAYCNYYHNVSNVSTYGRLYNWYAVNDSRMIAPIGWHIPSDAEWTTLTNYINSVNSGINLGKAMASKSGWTNSTTAGKVGNDQASNNSSGFTALPAGYHSKDGNFYYLQEMGNFWSSTESDIDKAYLRSIYYDGSGVTRTNAFKQFGYSIRCVKD